MDDLVARARARVGSVLNAKYRLDRVIGIGGMGVVYAATHRNQKQFAVKILHPELSLSASVRARFLREGYAANSFKHPGAVAVLDDDIADDGSAFLVMELLEGETVADLCDRAADHRLPLGPVLAIGDQLLDVLAAAHARAIVHRDIKPQNLFVTPEGALKVLDFGIARVRDLASSSAKASASGVALGTPSFMAPEQALGRSDEIDGQTDVWAVGATLFTLLSGELVHEGSNAAQVLVRAATQPARSLEAVMADAPPGVVALVDRALAYDRAERWPSAEAMRQGLASVREDLGAAASRPALVELVRARLPGPSDAALAPTEVSTPSRGVPPAAPAKSPIVASSTHPVSTGQRPPSAPPPRVRQRFVTALAFVAVTAVVSATWRLSRTPAAPAASPASVRPTESAPPSSAPSAAPPLPSELAMSAVPPPAASSGAPTTGNESPPARPHPSRPLAATAQSAPERAAASAAPRSRDDCAVPYQYDSEGNKKWKLECLKGERP